MNELMFAPFGAIRYLNAAGEGGGGGGGETTPPAGETFHIHHVVNMFHVKKVKNESQYTLPFAGFSLSPILS